MSGLLRAEAVHVGFRRGGTLARLRGKGWIEVVRAVSLTVAAGETRAIGGDSGSGKTTLARAMAGLLPVTAGRITFAGEEIGAMDAAGLRRLRRQVAFLFQDPVSSLSPRRRVRAQLLEPFAIHRCPPPDPAGRAAELLAMVGLSPRLLTAYPHQLSGGQARRVGIARALALSPALVIADEPTAGLDVSVQGEVLNLLAELQAAGGQAYAVVSHNLPVVRHVSDRVAVMYLGQIVESGPTARVFASPAHPYTQALVASVPGAGRHRGGTDPALSGSVPSLLHRPAGCALAGRCPRAMPVCRAEPPAERELEPGWTARCHLL